MSDEIKEILEELNKFPYGKFYGLRQEQVNQIKQLLDYITNLQEENKRLKEIIKDNIILVKDENGNYQECNINPLDYKSRCEKAIEYIKPKFIAQGGLTSYEINDLLNDLLNILQGEDKE